MHVQRTCMGDDAPSAPNADSATSGGDGAAAAQPKLTRSEQERADRDAFMKAMADGGGDEANDAGEPAKPPAKKPAPKKPEPKDDDGGDDDDVDAELAAIADEVDDEDDDDIDLDDEDDEDVESDGDDDKPDADAETEQRLAKVRKYEKKVREQAEAREQKLKHDLQQQQQAFVAEWGPKVKTAEKLDALKQSRDAIAILKEFNFVEDDFGELSQILYGLSKEGASDPKYREYSKKLARERSQREEARAALRKAEELEEKLKQRDDRADADKKIDAYREKITKQVSDSTPLAKKWMAAHPKLAQKELEKVALDLARKANGLVDPKKVVQTYEKKLRTRAERLKTLTAEDAAPGEKPAAAPAKKKPAIAVEDKTTAPTDDKKPAAANGRAVIPSREEMMRGLRSLPAREPD